MKSQTCVILFLFFAHIAASDRDRSSTDVARVWPLPRRQAVRDGGHRVDEEEQERDVGEPAQDDQSFDAGAYMNVIPKHARV